MMIFLCNAHAYFLVLGKKKTSNYQDTPLGSFLKKTVTSSEHVLNFFVLNICYTCLMQIVDVVRAYNTEVKWRDDRYVPKTIEEHLQVSARSGACHLLSCASFVGMRDIRKEALDWVSSMPRMVHALCIILRLSDDLEESYQVQVVAS